MLGGVKLLNNMERSGRCTERVDYKALNNLSSADLIPALKEKRKAKPGSKCFQVERLISKRKSATEVSRNATVYSAVLSIVIAKMSFANF